MKCAGAIAPAFFSDALCSQGRSARALARPRAGAWHSHVAFKQCAFTYAQAIRLDSSEEPRARAEHDQARVGDIAPQFAQNQQAGAAHAALDLAVI